MSIAARMAGTSVTSAMAALSVAVPLLGTCPALANSGVTFADPFDLPQLTRGQRTSLGLKASPLASDFLGHENATMRLMARFAQWSESSDPMLYSVERVPSALGLHSPERATGIVWRGGERWISSFESSTGSAISSMAARTTLTGQIHAPIFGGAGLSVGLKYSAAHTSGYGSTSDRPLMNGYTLPGRLEVPPAQLAYQFQLNYLYGERSTVALTYSSRRDWEQYRLASDPLTSDGPHLSIAGEHWFSPAWALRYDVSAPDSGSLMRRQGLRLGVHYRF